MRKITRLKLSYPHTDLSANPKAKDTAERYRVEQIGDSVEFSPGQLLTKKEVESLCVSPSYKVDIVAAKA